MSGTFQISVWKHGITTFSARAPSLSQHCNLRAKGNFSALRVVESGHTRSQFANNRRRLLSGKSIYFDSCWRLDRGTPALLSKAIHRHKANMVSARNSTFQTELPLLRKLLSAVVKPYYDKNPTAVGALELIRKEDTGPICYDHFAFRTFGVDGCGIDSLAQIFLDLGYTTRDELRFPAKKLRALWFSPPEHLYDVAGELEDGPMPRIFISEIIVDQLSEQSQNIIRKYSKYAAPYARHAATASVLNTLTWPVPSLADYQHLASESEYAAWTLVNGYSLNHATVSVHRLKQLDSIGKLNQFLQGHGVRLSSEGGILKVSPDGGLQQSSSVADSVQYAFADGEVKTVPASYIEFAERLVLPAYSNLKKEVVRECHRREGFEVGNADKIFESTSSNQTGVQRG